MIMRKAFLLGLAALGLWPCLAQAQALSAADFAPLNTTRDLYKICSAASGDPLYNRAMDFCEGFIVAVVNYDYAIANKKNLKQFICEPATATREEGIQTFVTWGAANLDSPKHMGEPPVVGVIRALHAKWPCQ
jgi:hypothetical protein